MAAKKKEIKNSDNNILIISEVKGKVFLPYKVQELKEKLENSENKYKDIQDIIEKEYTISLEKYKNAAISRFKETFKFMKEKENSSFLDAVDLSFELMLKRFLHPAIITACKNLDELDVYLDCLDKNELEEFPFFEIKYELLPQKSKNKNGQNIE